MTQDTYPIIIKPPMFNIWKILFWAIVIVAAILLYKSCHPDKLPVLQPVTSIAEQQKIIIHDSVVSKRLNDSIAKQVDYWAKVAFDAENTRDEVAMNNLNLQDQVDKLLSQPVSDSCEPLRASFAALNRKLALSALDAQAACNQSVNAQKGIVKNKDAIISNNNTLIGNLRRSVDTALEQQRKLQANIKKVMPRSSIYISATVIGSKETYLAAYGVGIGYMNKKQSQIEISAFQMKSQVFYSLSLKKPLFHF